jgi:hypothetical protein
MTVTTDAPPTRRWGTTREAAALIGYSVEGLRKLCDRGEGPPGAFKYGEGRTSDLRWDLDEVSAWIETKRVH